MLQFKHVLIQHPPAGYDAYPTQLSPEDTTSGVYRTVVLLLRILIHSEYYYTTLNTNTQWACGMVKANRCMSLNEPLTTCSTPIPVSCALIDSLTPLPEL